jgi:hypothetical protein
LEGWAANLKLYKKKKEKKKAKKLAVAKADG